MTYDELVSAIANWPDLQGEPDLQTIIPTLIVLAETDINNTAELRLREALVDVTSSVTDPTLPIDLPTDCLQVERVLVDNVPLTFTTLDNITVCTNAYAIDGSRLVFSDAQSEYTLRYYQRLPSLAVVNTHWLLDKSPSLYLYGSLLQAAIFSKENQQEALRYATEYQTCITRLITDDWNARVPYGQALASPLAT
jgi:hypothetical protein